MRAICLHHFGGLDSLPLEDVPQPVAGDGEVLIRIHAAGVNPIDWKTCAGQGLAPRLRDPFPFIPGWDVSGVVASVGSRASEFQVGEAVCGMVRWPHGGGGYAEYIAASAVDLIPKPQTLDHVRAAGLPLVALTAWQALFDTASLRKGKKVLIHAAAGGVGHIAVQLARWKGAHVVGTASARNESFLRTLGVRQCIDYRKARFEETVRDVDVVLDGVGGEVQERSWRVLKKGGMLVSIRGRPSPEEAAKRGVFARHVSVRADQRELAEIARLVDSGELQVHVDAVFPLHEARKAHQMSQQGHARGKIVLRVIA